MMRLTARGLLAAALALAPGAAPAAVEERIVFSGLVGGNVQIFSARPDGSDVRQLTFSSALQKHYPRIRPDGREVAYMGLGRPGFPVAGDIWTVDCDGVEHRVTTSGTILRSNSAIAWSSDGQHLYAVDTAPGNQVVRIHRASGAVTPLCALGGSTAIGDATWAAPDRVIATGLGGCDSAVFEVAGPPAACPLLYNHSPQADNDPRFSPDGQSIAWSAATSCIPGTSQFELWTIASNGNPATAALRVSYGGAHGATAPAWSPDGSRLLFFTSAPGAATKIVTLATGAVADLVLAFPPGVSLGGGVADWRHLCTGGACGEPTVTCAGRRACTDPGACSAAIACGPGVATCGGEASAELPSCAPGGPYPLGVTAVAATCAGAAAAATAACPVEVVDCEPPACSAPPPLALECRSPCGVPASDPDVTAWLAAAGASDNCSVASLTSHAPPAFPAGCGAGAATPVAFTARDPAGLERSCVGTVTVADTTPPAVSCPAPLVLECRSPGGVPAGAPELQAWIAGASASDACGPAAVAAALPPVLGSGCGAGRTTPIPFVATDGCGLAAGCSSPVTVADTTPPELTAPPDRTIACSSPGGAAATDPEVAAWLASAAASDACGTAHVTHDAPVLLPAGCGAGAATEVRFRAEDACGNARTASARLTVVDDAGPELLGCGLEAWDPLLDRPRAGQAAAGPASCASSGTFRVRCGTASDACSTTDPPAPRLIVTRTVRAAAGCVAVRHEVPIACDEAVEIELVAPGACDSGRCPAPVVAAAASGMLRVAGESVELHVSASDACGLTATCVTAAGLCAPAASCPVPACARAAP